MTGSSQFACCVSGILISLLVYGVLQVHRLTHVSPEHPNLLVINYASDTSLIQERLMSERFGDEQFKFSLLLVLVNRVVTLSTAVATTKVNSCPPR